MDAEKPADATGSHGGRRPGAGRPRTHGVVTLRKTLRALTTRRLDGRSALSVAIRQFKADIARDLGDDLTRAQRVILEDAAQTWIIRQALDDFIARQPSLVTKKRAVLPVVRERMQVAEHLAKQLDRLGLKRVPMAVADIRQLAGLPG